MHFLFIRNGQFFHEILGWNSPGSYAHTLKHMWFMVLTVIIIVQIDESPFKRIQKWPNCQWSCTNSTDYPTLHFNFVSIITAYTPLLYEKLLHNICFVRLITWHTFIMYVSIGDLLLVLSTLSCILMRIAHLQCNTKSVGVIILRWPDNVRPHIQFGLEPWQTARTTAQANKILCNVWKWRKKWKDKKGATRN